MKNTEKQGLFRGLKPCELIFMRTRWVIDDWQWAQGMCKRTSEQKMNNIFTTVMNICFIKMRVRWICVIGCIHTTVCDVYMSIFTGQKKRRKSLKRKERRSEHWKEAQMQLTQIISYLRLICWLLWTVICKLCVPMPTYFSTSPVKCASPAMNSTVCTVR